jgi:hypothetical protein
LVAENVCKYANCEWAFGNKMVKGNRILLIVFLIMQNQSIEYNKMSETK